MAKHNPSNLIGIYKITSPSGRVYVGQSWDVRHRWATYRCPGLRPAQPVLYASFKKYGAEAHEFAMLMTLPPTTSQTEMDQCEIFFISFFRDRGVPMLNLKSGGMGGRHSDETKRKIGLKSKGHPPTSTSFKPGQRLGFKHPAEVKEKISKAHRGKKLSDKTKDLIRARRTNQTIVMTPETRRKISEAHKGLGHTPETCAKISALKMGNKNRLGKSHSDETRRKISELAKERYRRKQANG